MQLFKYTRNSFRVHLQDARKSTDRRSKHRSTTTKQRQYLCGLLGPSDINQQNTPSYRTSKEKPQRAIPKCLGLSIAPHVHFLPYQWQASTGVAIWKLDQQGVQRGLGVLEEDGCLYLLRGVLAFSAQLHGVFLLLPVGVGELQRGFMGNFSFFRKEDFLTRFFFFFFSQKSLHGHKVWYSQSTGLTP